MVAACFIVCAGASGAGITVGTGADSGTGAAETDITDNADVSAAADPTNRTAAGGSGVARSYNGLWCTAHAVELVAEPPVTHKLRQFWHVQFGPHATPSL